MTEAEIALLKTSIDKPVEIETKDGEHLIAEVIFVTHDPEYDEHDFFFRLVDSDRLDQYPDRAKAGGYAMDFDDVASVAPPKLPLAQRSQQ